MNTNKDESFLFASESTIFRVISIARIVSWVLLGIYAVSFGIDLVNLFQGQVRWPTQVSDWLLTVVNLLFAPAIGLFYFLVLQGVAQILSLGLDIFYDFQPEEAEEEAEE